MDRVTTDKPASEMSMTELALNCCYGKDGWVWYRDFDVDIDLLDLMREYMDSYAPEDYVPADNKEFVEALWDNLQYDPIVDGSGLVALLHRNMWALAELRAHLKAYEDTGLTPEEIRKSDEMLRAFIEHNRTTEYPRTLDWLLSIVKAEAEGRLIVLPCKVGDTVYIIIDGKIHECEVYHISYSDYYGKVIGTVWTKGGVCAYFDHFGTCAFLTREEAEAALGREHETK